MQKIMIGGAIVALLAGCSSAQPSNSESNASSAQQEGVARAGGEEIPLGEFEATQIWKKYHNVIDMNGIHDEVSYNVYSPPMASVNITGKYDDTGSTAYRHSCSITPTGHVNGSS